MDVDQNWIEAFICAVQSKPCLYNKADGEYCNRDAKAKAWTAVCETVVSGWEDLSDEARKLKGKELQQRWTNLRHSFLRELREQKKSTSGQAAKKRRKYMYFEQLLFLLPTIEQRETVGNFDDAEICEQTDQTPPSDGAQEQAPSTSAPSTSAPSTSAAATATARTLKKKRQDISYEQKLLDILSEKAAKTEDIDEDKSFLLSFIPALKRMTPETKFEAKMEIMKVMHKFEHLAPNQFLPETQLHQSHRIPQSGMSSYPYESYSTAYQNPDLFRPIDASTPYYRTQMCSRAPSATSSYSDSLSYQNEDAN